MPPVPQQSSSRPSSSKRSLLLLAALLAVKKAAQRAVTLLASVGPALRRLLRPVLVRPLATLLLAWAVSEGVFALWWRQRYHLLSGVGLQTAAEEAQAAGGALEGEGTAAVFGTRARGERAGGAGHPVSAGAPSAALPSAA